MVKIASLDIASHYIGETAVPKTYKCEDTVFSAGGTGFTADVLIIGGGGGGGSGQGGGGGGGGYREFTKKYFTGINYTVTIGAGGSANSNGSNSNIERIADGGGAGGNAWGSTQEACNGKDGGSGGGTGLTSNTSFRKTYGGNSLDTRCNGSSQGYPAEPGPLELLSSGGAGGTGSSQNGGPGKTSNITGTSVGRGGGGACGFGSGTATDGGGTANSNGTVNTGGGGGGGGANGGSGFVVIKFPDTYSITIGGGLTYTSSTSGGYTTVQFTAGTDTISFSSFNPASISGLQLWLDADDSETITLNGSTVSQWDDKSGNSYHVSQGTASRQPTYTASALNSKSVVRFDGVNDRLFNTTAHPVSGSSNRTIFIVFNSPNPPSNRDYPLYLGASNGGLGQVFAMNQEIAVRVNQGNRVFNQSNSDGSHSILTFIQNGTNISNVDAWKNGSALSASSTLSRELNTGAGLYVGGHGDGTGLLEGDIAEIIVYNSALSTSDRESVESYLSTKWGISTTTTTTTTTTTPAPTTTTTTTTTTTPAPMTQTQTGGYTWLGDGSSSDKFRLDPSDSTNKIRGNTHSPYHSGWDSSNAPKWTINTAGTLNISRTGWSSADADSDHQIYKNGTLALTLSFFTTGTSTLSVSVSDVIEWRGGQNGNYQSDTYIINPELWIT